ncbi:dihydroorotase [Spiribacter vilamensis]|uniref:Dihydroorotase n=1 Tax=Spiribacter vilamensis TaxID=531306 RepID=A0A4Q8D141_9GAMM|nr:dihydroorotase [Spiribacter vilamensis]RZU99002.1 dihydroorotase [Spiribacter vilamensis]TVO61994.1 dihydroorotase [Spiribacter vilamensis]
MDTLTITRPDDWHLHLRDGAALADVVHWSAARFGRAIIMPNLTPPLTTTAAVEAYRERILAAGPAGSRFEPLMTLYLTDNTPPGEIERAAASGVIQAVKLYPAGATTNSDSGVTDLRHCDEALAAIAEHDLTLCIHGEVTHPETDIFDRETVFLEERLAPLLDRHRRLRVVLEHLTTASAVEFVRSGPVRLGATITPQHLLMNRNDLLAGGIRPHHYCLPILKRERDREALIDAATSGHPRFFLGTDSAPHPRHAKENACGCAGIFTAPLAIELYAEAFDKAGALDRLAGFASHFGADFYGLPRNTDTITLERRPRVLPATLPYGDTSIVPLRAGAEIGWSLTSQSQPEHA